MTLKEYKEKRTKDPAFKQAYVEIQPEMNAIRAMIDIRLPQNSTQKELLEQTGIV